ncbi:MAG: hypothetical protein AB1414_01290 [bacterium]
MVLNDTVNNTGLINDIDFLLKTDSTSYPTNDKKRNINRAYHKVVADILENMGEWTFQGDLASTNSVVDQAEYTFPTDILTIERVEIRYTSGADDYVEANPVSLKTYKGSIADGTDNYSSANPVYYIPNDTTIAFDPTPDTAISPAIKIWYTKLPTELSADTDEPVFAEPFHRILSFEATLDFCNSYELAEQRNLIKSQLNELWDQLRKYYSSRFRDKPTRLVPKVETYY